MLQIAGAVRAKLGQSAFRDGAKRSVAGAGLLALASTIRARCRRDPEEQRAPAWLHIGGVALIVVALFPYISATDDVLRIEHFSAQHDRHHPTKQNQSDDLMRLYETMDSPLVCRVCEVTMTFSFISLVFTPVATLIDRVAPLQAGRSPPWIETA